MSRVKSFVLIFRSLRAHKWLNVQMAICFAVLCAMATLFAAFTLSLSATQSKLETGYVSANYIVAESKVDVCEQAEEYVYYEYDAAEITGAVFGAELDYISYSLINIQYGGSAYSCTEDGSLGIYAGQSLFTVNDYREAEEDLLYGSYPASCSEICISQNLLENFGIDADDIIGKNITIYFIKNSAAVVDNVTVCGVIASGYYSLNGHNGGAYQIAPDIWANYGWGGSWNVKYVYSFSEWLTESQAGYYQGNYGCSYVGAGVIENINIITNMRTLTNTLVAIIGAAVAIGLFMVVYLLTEKFTRLFFASGGILKVCGMEEKALTLLLILQIIFILVIAFALAALLAWALYAAISSVIYSALFIELTAPSLPIILLIFAACGAVELATTLLLCLFMARKLRAKTVRDMLEIPLY